MERSHTFDNFYVHEGNEVALLAAKKIVEVPGGLFNPFYVFGGKGAGKTHLLHALNTELSKACTTLFMSARTFEKAVLDSMTFELPLIVDDLHKIGDDCKVKLLEIIEGALSSNIQLCFSADVAPREIKNLEAKICSYIESGLVCDLRPPEELARIKIFKKKADEAGFILSDEIAEELAQLASGSIGTIESMINRLVAYSSVGNMAIDSDSIKMILREFYPKTQVRAVSSVMEDMEGTAIWVADNGKADRIGEYEKRMKLWEMRGFDVSSLKEPLQKGNSDLSSAYRDFIERARKLLKLQDTFRTIDRDKHAVDAINAEAMLFDPQKVDELAELLAGLSPSVEGSTKGDDDAKVLPTTEGHEDMIVPLGLPGEDTNKRAERTEQQEQRESIDYNKVIPLSECPPVDIHNKNNFLMPDIPGELVEEKF